LTVNNFLDTFCDVIATGKADYVPSISVTKHQHLSARKYPMSIRRLTSTKQQSWKKHRKFRTTPLYNKYEAHTARCREVVTKYMS